MSCFPNVKYPARLPADVQATSRDVRAPPNRVYTCGQVPEPIPARLQLAAINRLDTATAEQTSPTVGQAVPSPIEFPGAPGVAPRKFVRTSSPQKDLLAGKRRRLRPA